MNVKTLAALGGKAAAAKMSPEAKTARARKGAEARWGATRAAIDALAAKLDAPQIQELIGDYLADQPEWVDAPMMARPMILRGVLDAVERQQRERMIRLGYFTT
jgi:hypothetical protein